MHFVDRGSPPVRLARVRSRLTPKWVSFYRYGLDRKPTDTAWRNFEKDLRKVFHSNCGYCEEICRGEVDHFRPKSRFPHLVYEWTNWVYSCHSCNGSKLDKWPNGGHVDPCASNPQNLAEAYFDFDLLTAEVLPRSTLTGPKSRRARITIHNLDLNAYHHLKKRQARLHLIKTIAREQPSLPPSRQRRITDYLHLLASKDYELSSITLAEIAKLGL